MTHSASRLVRGSRPWLGLAAALFLGASAPSPARAELIVSVGNVTASPGSTGDTIEVDLTNTGTSGVTLGAFSFGVSVGNHAIGFTDVTTATAAPYVFAGSSLFGPDITNPGQTLPGQAITASDTTTQANGVDVAAGATVGLGLVFYDVSSGALASVNPVQLTPSATSLSDAQGNPVTIDSLVPGSITVTGPGSATPEPSTLVAAVTAVLVGLLRARRRR